MSDVILVAHGFPSNPDPADAALADLACRVAALLPRHRVTSATLAKPGALAKAVGALPQARIYPFFMAEGWFTRIQLPRRLAALGVSAPILTPFGTDPALTDLVRRTVTATGEGGVILCAHGSQGLRSSHQATQALAGRVGPLLPGRTLALAFLEEPPHLREIAARYREAICLPLFALRAGHVERDIPMALTQANFAGRLLPAIGEHPEVPALIAAALCRG